MRRRQVHLDFHTSEKIAGIGEEFSKEQFQDALKRGHIDSITLFSKCHHGWAYHPTKVNEMHPHLKFDLLGAQIEAAHEMGVKTPVYLSTGWDQRYALEHWDDIVRWEIGAEPEENAAYYHRLCLNSPYLDYLLAQIKEVLENYDSDGIFLDIVGEHRCYCPNCMKTMKERGWDPEDYQKVQQLAEEVHANYTRRVRETIDSVKPGHPVFHNSGHITVGKRHLARMNSHIEIESLPTGEYGYDHLPLIAAYSRTLGMEYMGMTGKFHGAWGDFGGFKHPNALRYEAALSIANGAAFSIGDQLAPSGRMDEVTYDSIGAAYQEIEELEPWLKEGTFCTDIALLSQESVVEYYEHPDFQKYYAKHGRIFKGDGGAGRILSEGQYLFNMVDIEEDFSRYKVVILPDTIVLDEHLGEKMKAFTEQGGKVLATGYSGVNPEKTEYVLDFGVQYMGESEYHPDYIRPMFDVKPLGTTDYVMYTQGQHIENVNGTELAQHIRPYFNRSFEHFCSHLHTPSSGEVYGAGMVEGKDGIVIPWSIFEDYATNGALIAKLVVQYALDRLLGNNKSLTTSLPSKGIATLVDCGDHMRNHLLYAIPIKRGEGIGVIEDIVPLHNVNIQVKVGSKKIQSVYTVPQQQKLNFEQVGDTITYVLPQLENHQAVILDTK